MLKNLPVDFGQWKKKIKLKKFFGFIFIKVLKVPNIYIPFLQIKKKYQIIAPIGTWKGIYFSEELKFAKFLGYRFKSLYGLALKNLYF